MLPGVYQASRKDGSRYYRSNITYKNKHISLGSYDTEILASAAYEEARSILDAHMEFDEMLERLIAHPDSYLLPYDKIISLMNFRDHNMYLQTPIYMRKNYFSYYLDPETEYKFDIDDLFFYGSHKLQRRQGHLFVSEYGMQTTILSRYKVKSHAVRNRDYRFVNGDENDYRYSNIEVINPYYGVQQKEHNGQISYQVKIHMRGNLVVGIYDDIVTAAIAYNKAVDYVHQMGLDRAYPENYIEDLPASEYARIYSEIELPQRFINYLKKTVPGTT